MFEEINDFKIIVHDEKSHGMHYIPNIISINPLDELFKATEWLFKEALADFTDTHKRIDDRRRMAPYAHQENIDDIDELGIRLGSRIQGYVNQLCLMEDLLIFEYKRMASLMKEGSGGNLNLNPVEDYRLLRERFRAIRTFRDKVVAHTAYTYPKINKKTKEIEDNPETVVRSILNLFPREGKVTMGDNYFSGFSEYRSQLPVITIFSWEDEVRPIFLDWKNFFIEKLIELSKQFPIQSGEFKIDAANPHKFKQNASARISRVASTSGGVAI
jgi:hypothetical protein